MPKPRRSWLRRRSPRRSRPAAGSEIEGVDGAGWLYGIGKHLLSRYFRAGAVEARARRRLGMPERTVNDDDYERIEELIDFERVGEVLLEAMSTLPEDQREAVRLRVIDGRSYREVAAELGCTEPTARAARQPRAPTDREP